MFILGARSKRFWRPLIGVVVAYAVAIQSLLIVLGGFALTAHANGAPAFALCLHDTQDASGLPAKSPGHPGCSHCIFCFAGSHHALIGAPRFLSHRVAAETIDVPSAADKHCVPHLSAYSIASPRGPPLRA